MDISFFRMPEFRIARSLSRLFVIVGTSIMVAEIAIMFLFGQLSPMSSVMENFLDGILLSVLVSPTLFLFLLRPLSAQVVELEHVEKSLRLQNEALSETSRLLQAAQVELLHREKLPLLGQLVDTVGHEFRNPLGIMNNAMYFLQAELSDADDTVKEYLGIIRNGVADAERIVSDLLDAVRTRQPYPGNVDVTELIQQALHQCDIPASVAVHIAVPESLPAIRVDSLQIHQVFWNLMNNGVVTNGGRRRAGHNSRCRSGGKNRGGLHQESRLRLDG